MKKTLKKRRKTQIPHNATVIWGKITIIVGDISNATYNMSKECSAGYK
jgi:hypothetical protein